MMEFVFEEAAWEQAFKKLNPGQSVGAMEFLALTEELSEEELEQALVFLEENRITLSLKDLPKVPDSGAAAVRLRQERQLLQERLSWEPVFREGYRPGKWR